MRVRYPFSKASLIVLLIILNSLVFSAQVYGEDKGWFMFGHDLVNSRYNPEFSEVSLEEIKFLGDYETNGRILSSPSLGDLDNDGKLEIIFGSEDGYVYALKSNLKLLWKYKTRGKISSSPVVVDLEGDGNLEIIIGSEDGVLYTLSSEGKLLWKYKTAGKITSSPKVTDLEGDGKKEIVFGSWDKNLYILTPKGEKKISFKTTGSIESSPAIGDVDNNGRVDIVFGSNDNKIYIISPPTKKNALERIGTYSTSGDIISSPSLVDLDRDGFPEILVGSSDGNFYCLTFQETGREEEKKYKNGKWITEWIITRTRIAKKWSYKTSKSIISSPAVADLDSDGNLEIVVGSEDKNIYFFDHQGKRTVKYTVNDKIISSPSLADLDGDGQVEVVVVSFDGKIYILNPDGFRRWQYNLPSKVTSSPVIADLNADGKMEIIIGSWNKKLYLFGKKEEVSYKPTPETTLITTTLKKELSLNQQESKNNQTIQKEKNNSEIVGSFSLWTNTTNTIKGLSTGLILLLGVLLVYFSYKRGISSGIIEEDEKVITAVLMEREKAGSR